MASESPVIMPDERDEVARKLTEYRTAGMR
jgi:hypothetical protein